MMGNDAQAEFEQKQMDMRDQVVKFEKFIQENDAKRARAEAKAKQVRLTPLPSPPCDSLILAVGSANAADDYHTS